MSSLAFFNVECVSSSVDFICPTNSLTASTLDSPRGLSQVNHKQNILCSGVDMVVILKFPEGQQLVPVVLTFRGKNPHILFQFLVNLLGLSIGLWMICGRRCHTNSQESIEFPHEFHHEMRSAVRNHVLWKSVQFPDVVEVKPHCSACGNCRVHRDETRTLS